MSNAETSDAEMRGQAAGSETSGADVSGPETRCPGTGHVVTVYTRVNCSLCDTAVRQVREITADTGAQWSAVDVDADPDDRAEYGDRVPVILVDGVEHGYFTVDEERLRRALQS